MLLAATALFLFSLVAGRSSNEENGGLVNYQVKRVIYINSPALREELSMSVGLSEGSTQLVNHYKVVIPPHLAAQVSSVSAMSDGDNELLSVAELPSAMAEQCPIGARCFLINLPRPLSRNAPKITFGIGITYLNRYIVDPKEAAWDSPLQLRVEFSPYFYSPYPTLEQKSLILLVKEYDLIDISCPEPRNLKPMTSPSVMGAIPGSVQYTCGLYENVPALHSDEGAMWISFKAHKIPFFQAKKLDRSLEVDINRASLYVREDYEVIHLGHHLRDEAFPRLDFVKTITQRGYVGQLIAMIPLIIPTLARNVQIRDEVGVIHTPKDRRPSPISTGSRPSHLIELHPRFPLQGGWSSAWTLSYELPLNSFTKYTQRGLNQELTINIALFELFHDIGIESFSLSAAIPAEARFSGSSPFGTTFAAVTPDTEAIVKSLPLHAAKQTVYTIRLKNVTKEYQSDISIKFILSPWSFYRRPLVTAILTVLFGFLLHYFFSLNYSIRSMDREKLLSRSARLFRDRREIIKKIADRNKDQEPLDGLVSSLKTLQAEAQALLDRDAGDKMWNLATAAILRLYRDQTNAFVALIDQNNPSNRSKLETEASDIDGRIVQLEARILFDFSHMNE